MFRKDSGTGRFLPGNRGGGRPRGARNRLGEAFLEALHEDFTAHGRDAIQDCRSGAPEAYLRVIASLLPRELNLKVSEYDELTDEQLDLRIAVLLSAVQVRIGEVAGTEEDPERSPPPAVLPALS